MRRVAVVLAGLGLVASLSAPALAHDATRRHNVAHRRERVARVARRHLGAPYVWGGTSWKGYDCSGYTMLVYRHALGISLPHSSLGQAQLRPGWRRVWKIKALRKGDLVLYAGTYRAGISHTGIAFGPHKVAMAHGFGARSSVVGWSSYYRAHFAFGIRPTQLRVRR